MTASPTRTSDKPPRRDALEDTVPAAGDRVVVEEDAPIRPTIPIDRYRIGNELGRGGMGRVVEAFDVQLGRTVALKEVLPKSGGGTARRFAREIQITARLEHASIVPLYDSGINTEGKPFYVMRRVTGKPLDEMIARCRGLDERLTLLPAVLAAINAVAHAHERGVIHRDLKPANILVGELGETVVIDWGLAKVVGEKDEDIPDSPSASDSLRTQIGSVFGTPGFMAPEQARGEAIDLQGDVYALGAVLYQLLAGAPPVAGVSATEVMDKTRTHDIRPLSETAPGAPHELVAIVGKALEFDPVNRYPEAGALGEDVRRFLAGQLVAAHDYTNWQRLARFARRHRGALSVLALAGVAVAVMAWIGVHRILTERDAATTARHDADEGRREAEQARDDLAERHDALVVMQARALLDSNPTEALAILKQLSAKSPRIDDAHAIAQGAVTRGATWSLQSTNEISIITELDPEAKQLLQVSRDGIVRVFDLERRRLAVQRGFAQMTRASWVLGGKLLVTHHEAPSQLFDPATNTVEQLEGAPISFVRPSASGDRTVYETPTNKAGIYDAATRTMIPLEFPEPVDSVEIAPDASWVAVYSPKLVVIYDRDGKELARRVATRLVRVVGSRFGKLAIMDAAQILELELGSVPVWTEIPLVVPPPHLAIDLIYRGRELAMFVSNGDIMAWNGTRVFRRSSVDRMQFGMVAAGEDTLIVPSTDGKLYWINELGRGALALPGVMKRLRVATRPGSPRVAVVGDGIVHVFDLGAVIPKRFKSQSLTKAAFVDDETVLVMYANATRWEWLDIASGKTTKLDYSGITMPRVWDVDHQAGRVLVLDHSPKGMRFIVLRRGSSKIEVVIDGSDGWARLIPGDAVIYGLGDGRLFAKIKNAPAQQVAMLDGMAQNGTGLGHLTYAARSSTGEIVRGDLVTGKLDRVRVPIGAHGFLARDGAGRVLIVEDNRLLVWDGPVTEIAKFDKPISSVYPTEGGLAIYVGSDNDVYVLELKARATPHRVVPSSSAVATSYDGKLIAALGAGQNVTLVELPSRARWSLPQLASAQQVLAVAPSARKVLQGGESTLAIWQLPNVAADFGAWLDSQTNATIDADGVIIYPWQVPRTP